MSTTPTSPAVPKILPLTDAVRDAEAALAGDIDAPSLTTALKQLTAAVRRTLPVIEYTVKRDDNPVAIVHGYPTACAVARLLSHDTSGAFTVIPPAGSPVTPKTWIQGIPEENYGNGTQPS